MMRTKLDESSTSTIATLERLQAAFNLLKEMQPALYSAIHENLYIVLLHASLIDQRNKEPVTAECTSDVLKEIVQRDEKKRRTLYLFPKDDLKPLLQLLSVDALQKLLDASKNPTDLLQQLENMRKMRYEQVIQWKNQMQQYMIAREETGFLRFVKKAEALCWFAYRYSRVGLGGEFASLFGVIAAGKSTTQTVATYLKKMILQCTHSAVFYVTASQEKTERAHAFIAQCLTQRNTLILFKSAGILVGIYYTYLAGVISLFILLMMNFAALKASQQLEGVIDDRNARIVNYALPFDPSYTVCFRMMIMIIALLETSYTQRVAPCIRALTSLGSGIAAMRLGQRVLSKAGMISNQKQTPEQLFFLFVLSNVGYLFGELASSIGITVLDHIQEKTQARDGVIKVFRKHQTENGLTDLRMHTPSLLTPSSLWFNEENPLTVSWRNADRVYRMACEITPHEVLCNRVESIRTLI